MSNPVLPGKLLISVVVCTRNRSALLRNCLRSLAKQSAPHGSFEVLIVNNCSTDDTAQVIEEMVAANGGFRSFTENELGLSFARNRGACEALGEFVAYIDDDAEALPDWVAQMQSFLARSSSVAAFGGPYQAILAVTPPAWFPPEYGTLDLGERELSLDAKEQFLTGTNMVFHRETILQLGGFSTNLGMKGGRISYGEETRLQIDLKRQGHEIFYLPTLRVKHLVAQEKMEFFWLLKSIYSVGRCSSQTFDTPRTLFSCCAGICFGIVYALRTLAGARKTPLRRNLYYSLKPLVSELGALHQHLLRNRNEASHL
uniref:Glycosyl transferase family 2 n=1 Tax=Geobacter sp. (strain M21) TaxID=443144 RepID=C6E5U7_GEOSM